MQVRSVQDSASKFVKRASAADQDYKAGVQNAGGRWQAGAEASEDAYATGVSEALAEKRFGKGVRKAGAAKYQDNAVKLGPERFRTGVANAEQAYVKGSAPFVSAMASTTLSPRGARGSSQNANRVREQMDLMRRVRKDTLGS